jgi:uncharacterized RDD family membrane protein YckC
MKTFWYGGNMKKVNGIIRILSFLIDYIIIAFPVIFIMLMYFKLSEVQVELLFQLLLAVYGALFMEYMNGATLGKRFGKIKVVTIEDTTPTLVEYGMRELVKTIYFFPIVGWALAIVSIIMLFFKDGRTIHDRIAKTKVIYIWNQVEIEDEL